jgi:TPP-dependent pyruvate/acetoin dehydrogenase alpha subunit
LLDGRLTDEATLAAVEARVEQEIEDAVAFARAAADPGPDQLSAHVYGGGERCGS